VIFFFRFFLELSLIIFLELSEFLVTGFSYYCRHVSDQQLNFPRPKVLYHQEVMWRLRALVRAHRTLNTTSCSHRVAFVCPAGIDYYKNSHLRVAFVCGSGAIVWPSVGIVLASAVHWLLTKFGAIFVRNSKFHIRMAIWCQFRDSVTPALVKCTKYIDFYRHCLKRKTA
jgi:hypothetical protein